MTGRQLRRLRLRAQRLAPRQPATRDAVARITQVVHDLCGVQAQDAQAAALSIRARCTGLLADDVERARVDARSIVRTWLMRGTLHLAPTADLGWLLALLGPVFIRAGRARRAQLGLDDATAARGVRLLRDLLAKRGPLTRAEIAQSLSPRRIPTAGQAAIHLIGLAALQGVVCLGPMRASKPTYVLLSDWMDAGAAMPAERALAELARRYLAAYAPAAPEDFAAWSGLTLGQARVAWRRLAPQLREVRLPHSAAWLLTSQDTRARGRATVVRLLPAFDTYFMGYRSRDLALAPQHAKRIFPGGGLIHPALLVDGQALGRWRLQRSSKQITLTVEAFEPLSASVRRGLAAEAKDVARFLGADATLRLLPPSPPR